MTLMRTAMISPQIVGQDGAVQRLAAKQVYKRSRRRRNAASAAPLSIWRRVLIEGYPIAGIVLLFTYFARTLWLSLPLME